MAVVTRGNGRRINLWNAYSRLDNCGDQIMSWARNRYENTKAGEHPRWTKAAWRAAVQSESTVFGYWEWVEWEEEDEGYRLNALRTKGISRT